MNDQLNISPSLQSALQTISVRLIDVLIDGKDAIIERWLPDNRSQCRKIYRPMIIALVAMSSMDRPRPLCLLEELALDMWLTYTESELSMWEYTGRFSTYEVEILKNELYDLHDELIDEAASALMHFAESGYSLRDMLNLPIERLTDPLYNSMTVRMYYCNKDSHAPDIQT